MSTFATRPLVFSTLLHASVAALLLVMVLRLPRSQPDVPHVLEWIPTEALAPNPTREAGPVGEPSINFKPVRVIVPVREATVEPVVEEPVRPRTPVPSRPAPRTATPVRTPPTQQPRRPAPTVASSAGPATSAATTVGHIDLREVLAAGEPAIGSGRVPSVATDPAREASYWEMLLGKLREAHEKPAGLDDGLKTRVEFVLNADGSVGTVRILQSSGNPEFDASVVAAFRRLRDLGAPPAGKVGLNQVTFRTRAD